jgi:hypothetical protein
MARISRYDFDNSVSKSDKIIGTDSSGSATRNFKLEDVAGFLNTSSLINVNGQLVYKFKNATQPISGTFNLPSGGIGTFNSQTAFEFSHVNSNDQNIKEYINYFDGLFVMFTQTDNQNNFAQYSINSINESSNYSTLNVTFREGNGSFIADKYYAMSFSPKGQTDKNYVSPNLNFLAGVAQTITHNLNKFPSVTVVDSGGSHIVGDVQHINENSFTITFTASFQAKVYAN